MANASWIDALLSTQSPLLPLPWLERGYLALAWGLVLAAVAVAGLSWRGRAQRLRWLPAALLLLCFLPGANSPAYWLGLAFRAPSLLLTVLCGWIVVRHYRAPMPGPAPHDAARAWAPGLTLLGWVLLLDAFAFWPVSVYAWGFAPVAFGALVFVACGPWLWRGDTTAAGLLLAPLLLYLLLRLPSGNVWDALLDPWLWLLLQTEWLRRLWQQRQR